MSNEPITKEKYVQAKSKTEKNVVAQIKSASSEFHN